MGPGPGANQCIIAANLAREHWKLHANPESCIANNAQIPSNAFPMQHERAKPSSAALIGMHYEGFGHYFQYSSRDLRVISNAPEPNSQQWHCFISSEARPRPEGPRPCKALFVKFPVLIHKPFAQFFGWDLTPFGSQVFP